MRSSGVGAIGDEFMTPQCCAGQSYCFRAESGQNLRWLFVCERERNEHGEKEKAEATREAACKILESI
jgi:hypothetical protein